MAPIFFKELVLDGQAANALVCHLLFLLEALYFLRLFFIALKNLSTSLQELPFPLAHLVRVNLKLLGKF